MSIGTREDGRSLNSIYTSVYTKISVQKKKGNGYLYNKALIMIYSSFFGSVLLDHFVVIERKESCREAKSNLCQVIAADFIRSEATAEYPNALTHLRYHPLTRCHYIEIPNVPLLFEPFDAPYEFAGDCSAQFHAVIGVGLLLVISRVPYCQRRGSEPRGECVRGNLRVRRSDTRLVYRADFSRSLMTLFDSKGCFSNHW